LILAPRRDNWFYIDSSYLIECCLRQCCGYFQALYFTGNYNADLAAAWIFENQDKNLDAEFNEVHVIPLYFCDNLIFLCPDGYKLGNMHGLLEWAIVVGHMHFYL